MSALKPGGPIMHAYFMGHNGTELSARQLFADMYGASYDLVSIKCKETMSHKRRHPLDRYTYHVTGRRRTTV